jgi:hypothetical protein
MVVLILHSIQYNNLNLNCDNINIEGIYLPIITGISGYWLPSPSNSNKIINSNSQTDNNNLTSFYKIKKKINNIFIIQTIVSILIMIFCMGMLIYNKECNVQGVYLPILTGISTYWVPSPGVTSNDLQHNNIDNNNDIESSNKSINDIDNDNI